MVVVAVRLGEFGKGNLDLRKGGLNAVLCCLKYLVLPLVLLSVALAFLNGSDAPRSVPALLEEMRFLAIVFGAALTALGFFKGAYPKGSYSRLTFGVAVATLAIVYALSLLLGGRVESVFSREAFELDLDQLFALYFVGALFTVFLQLAEFIDHRRSWMEGTDRSAPREAEDPLGHRWYHDFRLRYGTMYRGLRLARGTLTGFVIMPMALIIILKAGFGSLDIEQIDELMSSLDGVFAFMLLLGLPMTVLAFFKGFYPRGSWSRFLPALAMVLISLYWIWVIGLEGRIIIEAMDGFEIGLDYSGILLLIMCGTALWAVYYALELWLHRREWMEGGFKKDHHGTMVKEKAPAVQESISS